MSDCSFVVDMVNNFSTLDCRYSEKSKIFKLIYLTDYIKLPVETLGKNSISIL